MKAWQKTSIITTVSLILLLIVLKFIFKITLSFPSSDIEFAPSPEPETSQLNIPGDPPKNIILFIADGFGFSHLSLGLQTAESGNNPSIWQRFDVRGWHDARSLYGSLTDSEASATAIATGTKTNFGHIGVDQEGKELVTVFDEAVAAGYNTAIVTDSYVWDGTPAAFLTHTRNEDDARDILIQIAAGEVDLLFGELEDVGENDIPEKEESLNILSKRFLLLDHRLELPATGNDLRPVAAIFEEDEIQDLDSSPNLPQLTSAALRFLNSSKEPFMLLVECEEMDAASHDNDSDRIIKGMRSLETTLSLVREFTETDGETLLVFTADHETGGLAVLSDFDSYPNLQLRWSDNEHSAAVVPLFAHGPGARAFDQVKRNWEIGLILRKLIESASANDHQDPEVHSELE